MPLNEFGQPVGEPLDWSPGPSLGPVTLSGRTSRLEPLGEQHLDGLHDALCRRSPDSIWTYLSAGPHADRASFTAYVEGLHASPGAVPLAVLLPDGTPVGVACWLRIDQANGTAEVGNIAMSAQLQRTTAATEAMHLMAAHAFEVAGIRRYEWKCDALNAPSRRAAERLGFRFEGIFRKAVVNKGRTRDTAWFSITDDEWPAVAAAHRTWLHPANFEVDGVQVEPLWGRSPRGRGDRP